MNKLKKYFFITLLFFCSSKNTEKKISDNIHFDIQFTSFESFAENEPFSLVSEHIFSSHSSEKNFKQYLNKFEFDEEYKSFYRIKAKKLVHHRQPKKQWTILVYIAGDNDLYKYAIRNLEQLQHVGSNDNVNILVHFDHREKKKKISKRFYVEKNNLLQIGELSPGDSGDTQNLVHAAEWAIHNYPSQFFGIVLWNHGTGPYDPDLFSYTYKKQFRPNDFFYFDTRNKKISINRNIEFFELLKNSNERGICFDDSTRNYLNNKKLTTALAEICKARNNEKIDIIMMDACLMAGIEIAYLCSRYAKILTASEEVVLGPGYNYSAMFKILAKEKITPYNFAIHVVKTYQQTYGPIANDFTQSAINLSALEEAVEIYTKIVSLFSQLHQNDQRNQVKKLLSLCGSKEMVTHFAEPSYIDLKHFLDNILYNLNQYIKNKYFDQKDLFLIKEIKATISEFLHLYPKLIIANSHGRYVPHASGLFIYFPTKKIEQGYKNEFATKTRWTTFLQQLLAS